MKKLQKNKGNSYLSSKPTFRFLYFKENSLLTVRLALGNDSQENIQ